MRRLRNASYGAHDSVSDACGDRGSVSVVCDARGLVSVACGARDSAIDASADLAQAIGDVSDRRFVNENDHGCVND